MAMLRNTVWSFCAGVSFSLATASAQADTAYDTATDAAPCLTASTDIAAFRAAFETAGWAEVQGAARTQAMHALGEIIYIVRRWPKIGDPDFYAEFIRSSHAEADKDRDWDLVMMRDGLSVGVSVLKIKDNTHSVACYLTGADIPGVNQAMTRPDARLPNPERPMLAAIGFYTERLTLPGYEKLSYNWFLIDPPYDADPPPLAVNSIIVNYGFQSDTPPVPPPAPRP